MIGLCDRALESHHPLVKSGNFLFFICPREQAFKCVSQPFSRGGNFGLPGTWPNYSSSCIMISYEPMWMLESKTVPPRYYISNYDTLDARSRTPPLTLRKAYGVHDIDLGISLISEKGVRVNERAQSSV